MGIVRHERRTVAAAKVDNENNTEINENKVIAYLEMIYLLYTDNKEEMSTMNIDYEILQTAYLFLKTYKKQKKTRYIPYMEGFF